MLREVDHSGLQMLHDLYNTSKNSTPSRLVRGVDMPMLDTGTREQCASAFLHGGCLTPPQSAHESRRGSLAYGTLQDPSYLAAPTAHVVSQPTTPLHTITPIDYGFNRDWSQQQVAFHLANHNGATPTFHDTQISASEYNQALNHASTSWSHRDYDEVRTTPNDLHMSGTWRDGLAEEYGASDVSLHGAESHIGLGPSLFPTHPAVGEASSLGSSIYCDSPQSAHGLHIDTSLTSSFASTSASVYQQQQATVAPCQVSPEGSYVWQGYQAYSSPNGARERLTSSLTSDASFSTLDYSSPQTPEPMYVDDFELVQVDRMSSTPVSVLGSYHESTTSQVSHARPRRKGSKRGKPRQARTYWTVGGGARPIFVEAETEVSKDPVTSIWSRPGHPATPAKPHVCRHPVAGGICGARFERSEHLKRHQNKHSDTRQFQCPFKNHENPAKKCKHEKGVSRSDNAGDHFKSHLKQTPKGRRNPPLIWPEVKEAIQLEYDDKAAKKLITNLEKWIATKAEGACQRKYLQGHEIDHYDGVFY